ncbi:MAG: hypothetical protein OEZ13_11795 [Spirochaetia bacterium]|nr:hypothetical protein [Spirochaetia bacterium]
MKAIRYIKENGNTIGIIIVILASVVPIYVAWYKNQSAPSQELLAKSQELKLNNGKRWESNVYTEKAMASIIRGISGEIQNSDLKHKDFKEIKQLLTQLIEAVAKNNQLQEEPAIELKKLLSRVSLELPRLGSADLKEARSSMVEIERILKTYYDFFVFTQ